MDLPSAMAHWRRRRLCGAVAATLMLAGAGAVCASSALAAVQPYGTNDFRGFRNVLPPGTNGLVNLLQLAGFESAKSRPPHNSDQLAMYSNLTTAAPNIQPSQIGLFYKDATFGVQSGNVESVQTPEPGATIIRDKQYGVPHIYGDTRAELMFGIGYATGQDRLFFIDVLRHAGEGDLAQFAGGANVAMDRSVWSNEPYTHQDLVSQVQYGRTHLPDGPQISDDAANFVAGINAYIAAARSNPLLMPAEYAALGILQGPQPFTTEDLVSIAALVGGIFGKGGGAQLSNAVLYEQLRQRFGVERRAVAGSPETPARKRVVRRLRRRPDHSGFATLLSLVDPSDPEAPTTVRGHAFPYQTLPKPTKAVRSTVALPDPGSVQFVNPVVAGAVPRAGARQVSARGHRIGLALGASANAGPGLMAFPRDMSNALLVSGAHSVSGHPLAVMGPQVAYFAPQILMEEDIHGPGIDANGAAFPGVNLYVELGHGQDYAWSATSSGQNIVDTFAVPLCSPSGGAVSPVSDYYLLGRSCVPMEVLTRTESWQPNLADATPAGSITLQSRRTAYGLVIARARIHGRPVAYTKLRSTYLHELDSVVGFEHFNEPAQMRNPQAFFNAANAIGYTFNWFYTDDKHIAYFNSGHNPIRAAHTNPLFPTWANYAWRGLTPAAASTPASSASPQTSQGAHPHIVDQSYLTSWNNKQAPGYNDAATAQQFSSIYRSQLLDQNINHYLARGQRKLTLTDLINAMGNAGTQDLRGVEVLPYALRIIGHPTDPVLAGAVRQLQAWVASGAHRINRAHPGASGNYEQSAAIRILDAWWPRLVNAEFGPVLGTSLLSQVQAEFPINDQPGHGTSGEHLGSSWDVGFYGIVQKDLRAALGQRVAGRLNRVYCGSGSLRSCRSALESSLLAAAAASPAQVYPADGVCAAGDQMCSDSIQFRAIGAVTQPLIEWVNRPTFQQVVEIQGHGLR
ncbi:MAG: penicillin acylase family protein [Solirubrobacteraceae bacterium]